MRELSRRELGNPLLLLEQKVDSTDLIDAQVVFCAKWCLDNLCEYCQLISYRLGENKVSELSRRELGNPLLVLEQKVYSTDLINAQVVF